MKLKFYLTCILSATLIFSCKTETQTTDKPGDSVADPIDIDEMFIAQQDSLSEENHLVSDSLSGAEQNDDTSDIIPDSLLYGDFPYIKYQLLPISSREELNKFLDEIKEDEIKEKVINTLNRKELRFIRVGDSVVVPDTFIQDITAYSMFPYYYENPMDSDKIIIVSAKNQSYGCYENNRLIRFAATNTGKRVRPTPKGIYSVNWKRKNHRSSFDSTWIMPYTINIHSRGIAMHQYNMPGYPASHRCLRQFMDDAVWLFYWTEGPKRNPNNKRYRMPNSGTPVVIIDEYDFTSDPNDRTHETYKPWKYFPSNRKRIKLPTNFDHLDTNWKKALH